MEEERELRFLRSHRNKRIVESVRIWARLYTRIVSYAGISYNQILKNSLRHLERL